MTVYLMLLLLGSLALCFFGGITVLRLYRIRRFKPLDAEITVRIDVENENQVRVMVEKFIPRFEFSYEIGGNRYRGDSSNLERYWRFYDEKQARDFADDIVSTGKVFVNDAAPGEAFVWRPETATVINQSGVLIAGLLTHVLFWFLLLIEL